MLVAHVGFHVTGDILQAQMAWGAAGEAMPNINAMNMAIAMTDAPYAKLSSRQIFLIFVPVGVWFPQ